MQFVKPILKHVTSKFSVQKQQFYSQFKLFLKAMCNNGFEKLKRQSFFVYVAESFPFLKGFC